VPGCVTNPGVARLFLAFVLAAKSTGHWDSPISNDDYRELIPHAREFSHPR
jgi:hypothetical protein